MPLVILYVASTTDSNPLSMFQALNRAHTLPQLYQKKIYDFDIPKVFLLVNDCNIEQTWDTQGLFDKVQKGLSPCFCQWINMNSAVDGQQSSWGADKGYFISNEDICQMQMFISELTVRVIAPFVSESIRKLDTVIEQKRRGFKNSLIKLFKKNNERVEMFSFTVGNIEYVGRLIADIHLLFKDYENALNLYKSAAADFKTIKAHTHAGAALEMQAFCMAFLGMEFRELEYVLDAAYVQYQKADDHFLIGRCAIYTKLIYSTYGQFKKLPEKLQTTGLLLKDIPLVYGLFFEQAALCYLKMKPPKVRKYAFYMILAGNEYRENQMGKYALNSYYSGSHIYSDRGWDHIAMHLFNMLGRFCYYLNLNVEAVHFFLELASCKRLCKSSDNHQKKVLNELLATISRWNSQLICDDFDPISKKSIQFGDDQKPILDFYLPKVKSYEIVLPQDRLLLLKGGTADCASWSSLLSASERSLIEEFASFDNESPVLRKRRLFSLETIEVTIKLYNPLELLLIIDNVQIVTEPPGGAEINVIETLELKAKSEIAVSLQITPLSPGELTLLGVQWTFGKVFHGFSAFKTETFTVEEENSDLNVTVVDFPETLLHGEIQSIELLLTNSQKNPVENLVICVSNEYMFGKKQFPVGDLAISEAKPYTLWLRGALVGQHNLRCAFFYSSLGRRRFSRLQTSIKIRQSLSIDSRVEYSLKDPHENILILSVHPLVKGTILVKQISSLTAHSLKLITTIEDEIYYLNIKEGTEYQDIGVQPGFTPTEVRSGFCWDVHELLKQRNSSEINLLVSWEIHHQERVHRGHDYLHSIEFYNKPRQLPVHMTIQCPNVISHSFSVEKILKVPVELCVKNILKENFVFLLEALDNDVKVGTEDCAGAHYWWNGAIRQQVSLLPGQVKSYQFCAVFAAPGSYNVNRFSVTLPESSEKHLMDYSHWLVINTT